MNQKLPEIVECDYCQSTEDLRTVGNDTICPSCLAKRGTNKVSTPPNLTPIPLNAVLQQAETIDNTVAMRTDIFNAETVAIADIKKAIDTDESIVNKAFALAETVAARREKFKRVIFELGEQMKAEQNKLRATQTYLNQLSNQLRAEEREKLKIADINYKPNTVKMPVTAKTIKASIKKLDKDDLRKLSAELGIAEHTIRSYAIQKNCKSVEDVRKIFKKIMESE